MFESIKIVGLVSGILVLTGCGSLGQTLEKSRHRALVADGTIMASCEAKDAKGDLKIKNGDISVECGDFNDAN